MTSDDAIDRPKPREPVFRNTIQFGQLLQIVPMLGVLGLLIKLVFIAGATYTAFTSGLEVEKASRIADIKEMQREVHEAEDRLTAKIENNSKLESQQIEGISSKLVDMKDTVSDMRSYMVEIVKASTPAKR